jgi:hypothetical protein
VEAEAKARAILDALSDEEYSVTVRESSDDQHPLKMSSKSPDWECCWSGSVPCRMTTDYSFSTGERQ